MNIIVGKDTGSYTFDATAGTITFSGIGTVTLNDIFLITNVTDNIILYNFASVGRGGTITSNVLTLQYDTSLMSDTDIIQIVFNVGFPYIDFGLGLLKTQEQSPLWSRYTSPEALVSAQDLTTSYVDYGAEIDMQGYNELTIYMIADCNTSEDAILRVLGKYESAGVDEFLIDGVTEKILWSGTSSDFNKIYNIRTGSIPYLQLQAKVGTLGTAGDLTLYISKSWKPI